MTGTLADALAGAFSALGHPVTTAQGEAQEPAVLLALAERVQRELVAHGVGPDEPVHVRIGNRPADIGALLGVWNAGAVAVPMHVAAAASTLERVQAMTRARFLIDGDRLAVIGRAAPPRRELLRDAALVIFTSGSTGLPKGVVIGHRRFGEKLQVLDRLLGVRADDTVLLPLQLTFVFGLWVALLALTKGARLLLLPKADRATLAQALAGSSVLAAVPSMLRTLPFDAAPPPKLRLILTGGEVLASKLAGSLRRFTPAAIYDLYGLTETGSCDFCLGPADQPQGFGSIGRATDGVTFRIAETGELQIRTPFGMLGYLDEPQLTAAAFEDGFFKTGDLAKTTAGGHVALVGRAKDLVSRGGIKIAPLEVDNLLAEHPDIAAALCAGVPDERLGEVIHAVVVPRKGSTLDVAKLRHWLLERTERFKVPEVIYVRDVLPSGATGKADRRAVARLAEHES
jgi:acyl-CoA synthetase (AMP-forming)/AMP-acid ligase II